MAQGIEHPTAAWNTGLHCLEVVNRWLLLDPISIPRTISRILQQISSGPYLKGTCRKQMQSLHLDSHTKQDPNGRQLAAKKLATPRPLRAVQWTTRNSPSLLLRLVLGWEHFDVDLIRPQVQPSSIRAWWEQGRPTSQGRDVDTSTGWSSTQCGTFGRKEDFPKFGDGCPAGSLQNQRGYRPML